MSDSTNPNLRAYLCLTITTFFWGCNAVFAKLAVGEVSPMLLVSLRWLGVVLLLLLFVRKTFRYAFVELKPHIPLLFLMGVSGFTAFNVLFYVAAHSTSALNIGIIQGAIPVLILTGSIFFLGSRIVWFQVVGMIFTVIGVAFVVSAGDLEKMALLNIGQGDYFMMLACFLYAIYSLNLRKFSGVAPLGLFSVMAVSAFISSVPVAAFEYFSADFQWPTTKGWVIISLITIMPSFLSQILFIQGVSDIGPGRAGIFVNLVPVFSSFLAVVILGEFFQTYHMVSLGLVLGGIWLSEQKMRKNSSKL